MTDDVLLPTLAELARDAFWTPGFGISSSEIDEALKTAGIPISNEKERTRFISLARDAYYMRLYDELAELGRYADEARRELGDEASLEDVIDLAYGIKEDEEYYEDDN